MDEKKGKPGAGSERLVPVVFQPLPLMVQRRVRKQKAALNVLATEELSSEEYLRRAMRVLGVTEEEQAVMSPEAIQELLRVLRP